MSDRRNETLGLILKQGLLPNLIKDDLDPFAIVEEAAEVGIRCFEVSCRRADTRTLVPALKSRFPSLRFGVSSLIEDGPYFDFLQQRGPRFPAIAEAAEIGADFLVSVISFSPTTYLRFPHLPIVPGVDSPDQARRQLDLGAALIKFSLGGLHDAQHVKALFHGGPMHFGVPLLLTGGVRPERLEALIAAGMMVAVAGFDLILKGQYQEQQKRPDYVAVRAALAAYVVAFAEARAKHQPEVDFTSGDAARIQQQSGRFMNVRAT